MATRGRGGCGGARRGARPVSAMGTFVVTFRFASPPILRGALTLDAVLGGELARGGGSLAEAIGATPLARTDGVHHGSALVLLGDTGVTRQVPVIQNLWAELTTADAAAIAFERRRVAPGSVKSVLNEYEARVTELAIARADGRYPKLLASIAKTELLIIDDWGLAKLNAENRRDLLEIIEDRYAIRSTVVTSQLPVEKWHDVVADPTLADAILDRLVHRAYQINLKGESMRKRRATLTQTSHRSS